MVDQAERQARRSPCVLVRVTRRSAGNPGDVRPVGAGVSEIRINYGPGYRVYFLQDGRRLILLLCGGDKSSQADDIKTAQRIAEQWRRQGADT